MNKFLITKKKVNPGPTKPLNETEGPFLRFTMSERPGSNWRPQPWQGCALPTELLSQ